MKTKEEGTFLIQGHLLETSDCHRVTDALAHITEKWAVLIVMHLDTGPKRFNELRHLIHGISQKMLTSSLRGLTRDGFVARTVFPTNPPSVVYELTGLGREFVIPITTLGVWVLENLDRVKSARERFDAEARTLKNRDLCP